MDAMVCLIDALLFLVNVEFCHPFEAPIGYSVMDCDNRTIGAACVIGCHLGFYGTANVPICNSSGLWSTVSGCNPVTCNGSLLPPNAHALDGTCTERDPYMSSCIIQCDDGYVAINGSAVRTCDRATPGPYIQSDLVCEVICSAMDVPLSYDILDLSTCTAQDLRGSVCLVSCSMGYYYAGGSTAYPCNYTESAPYDFDLKCIGMCARHNV